MNCFSGMVSGNKVVLDAKVMVAFREYPEPLVLTRFFRARMLASSKAKVTDLSDGILFGTTVSGWLRGFGLFGRLSMRQRMSWANGIVTSPVGPVGRAPRPPNAP